MADRMVKSRRNKSKKGGAAVVMPLQYYNPAAYKPSAGVGHDLLGARLPTEVRPKIGGKRRTMKRHRKSGKSRKIKGGFIPSIMDGFVAAASRFIVPVALYSGYKLLTKKTKKNRKTFTL